MTSLVVRPAQKQDEVRRGYADLLVPAFAPDELALVEDLVRGWRDGSSDVVLAVDAGRLVGAAVAEVYPQSETVLLAWLAVARQRRSSGVGSRLHRYCLTRWVSRHDPALVLAEVEHPAAAAASEDHGDPASRLRFYARHGARALDLPYFQPPVRPGGARVFGLVLLTLAIRAGLADESSIAAEPVRRFIGENLPTPDGADPAATALLTAAGAPRIGLLDLDDVERLPLTRPGPGAG